MVLTYLKVDAEDLHEVDLTALVHIIKEVVSFSIFAYTVNTDVDDTYNWQPAAALFNLTCISVKIITFAVNLVKHLKSFTLRNIFKTIAFFDG